MLNKRALNFLLNVKHTVIDDIKIFADDFIITASSREIAEELKTIVSHFLKLRGLTLSEEKTKITHIDKGFDYLGWTFKKYKGNGLNCERWNLKLYN